MVAVLEKKVVFLALHMFFVRFSCELCIWVWLIWIVYFDVVNFSGLSLVIALDLNCDILMSFESNFEFCDEVVRVWNFWLSLILSECTYMWTKLMGLYPTFGWLGKLRAGERLKVWILISFYIVLDTTIWLSWDSIWRDWGFILWLLMASTWLEAYLFCL